MTAFIDQDHFDFADDFDILCRLREKLFRALAAANNPTIFEQMLAELQRTGHTSERVAVESTIGPKALDAVYTDLVDAESL